MYCKGRVLIVDDVPDVRATLSGLLADEGYDVRSASSRVEALQMVDAERFHVAVIDVRLDEAHEDNQDGLLLMDEIRKKYPNVAIIILTGYANVKMVQEAQQPDCDGVAPAFGFLEKSEVDQLPEYVSRALEHALLDTTLTISDLIAQGENDHVAFKASIHSQQERTRKMCSDSEQKQGLEPERDKLLGKVAGDIAHHVKNRTGLIRLAALRLLNDPVVAESPSRRKEVEKILRNAEAAGRLATDLLQPYRELKPELVKVDGIIEEAIMIVGVPDDVTLLQEIALGLPKVAVEPSGAISVFQELLANALRAVRAVEKPRQIKISAQLSKDGYVEVLLGNNGPAIPKERWETIFEQFAVADERIGRGEGFGLGLWTARIFLRRQGGEVRVLDSDPVQTTFIIRLPVAPAEK